MLKSSDATDKLFNITHGQTCHDYHPQHHDSLLHSRRCHWTAALHVRLGERGLSCSDLMCCTWSTIQRDARLGVACLRTREKQHRHSITRRCHWTAAMHVDIVDVAVLSCCMRVCLWTKWGGWRLERPFIMSPSQVRVCVHACTHVCLQACVHSCIRPCVGMRW